eukprot:1092609_1
MTEEQQRLTVNDTTHRVVDTQPVQREVIDDTKGMDDKCKIKILFALNILWILIIVIIVLCGVYADTFGRYKQCENKCSTVTFDDTNEADRPDGNQFDFDTVACEGYRDLWDDPSVQLDERNQIGRAIYQTPAKMQQAIQLIKQGKTYDLFRPYHRNMPHFGNRYFNTTLICAYVPEWSGASCTAEVKTNGIGNVGTQFDSFGHFFSVDLDNSSAQPTNENFVLFNNFRGDEVFNHYLGDGDDGVNYLGVEKLPTFFTRAILVDIAGYKGVERLEETYNISIGDFMGALDAQGLAVENITKGDAVLIYTGWSVLFDTDPELFYDWDRTPGVSNSLVLDVIYPRNVMIIGADTWGIDTFGIGDTWAVHQIFLACGGGFNHENLKLDEWVMDARSGDVPWIGAYLYQPLPVLGGVAAPGKPVVFVQHLKIKSLIFIQKHFVYKSKKKKK